MLWILGAIALVAAVYGISWWLVNHGNPVIRFFGRHPRLRFTAVVAITVAIGVFAFLFLFYPERIFGLEGGQLGSSLAREVKRSEGGNCRLDPKGGWRCSIDVGGASEVSSRVFLLTDDGGACWEATEARPGKGKPQNDEEPITGCVGVLDFVAPQGRDFGGVLGE